MHLRIKIGEAACRKSTHLARIEHVSHPDLERPREDGNVLSFRVPVRRDAVSIWHFQADSEIAGIRRWVSLNHRQLRSGSDERRWRSPRNRIRRKRILLVRTSRDSGELVYAAQG